MEIISMALIDLRGCYQRVEATAAQADKSITITIDFVPSLFARLTYEQARAAAEYALGRQHYATDGALQSIAADFEFKAARIAGHNFTQSARAYTWPAKPEPVMITDYGDGVQHISADIKAGHVDIVAEYPAATRRKLAPASISMSNARYGDDVNRFVLSLKLSAPAAKITVK